MTATRCTRSFVAAAACLAAGPLSGCYLFGPTVIGASRAVYNEVVNRTGNEQLLLNLVRLRYRDTPCFLEVGSLTTSFSFSTGLPRLSPSAGNQFEPSFGYREGPTISYSPLRGDKFVKQLLSPLKLDTVVLLYHSGWSVERVFRCCVQRMNGIRNAPSASGPTPNYVPIFKEFHRATKIMRKLQVTDGIGLGADPTGRGKGFAIMIAPSVADSDDARELRETLGVNPEKTVYSLTPGVGDPNPNQIGVTTRSLLGVFFYLSQSVEVPLAHVYEGKVTETRTKEGHTFEWSEVTGDVMRIQSSRRRPMDAAVAVPYRGYWFYIVDSDLNSKTTFSLLSQLFSLQAGGVDVAAPLLMLPTE